MVTNFGVCDFSRLAVTDWRLRRRRLWFLALSNAPKELYVLVVFQAIDSAVFQSPLCIFQELLVLAPFAG